MFDWLVHHWFELSFGFFCGAVCSLARKIWLSLLLSAGLVLMMYSMLVSMAAHAGTRWSNETAIVATLGCLLGSLVCPVLDRLYHKQSRDKLP